MEKICYKCGQKATSKEHIPPKCIFPEKKDVGEDYKVNLITVDSCDEHNLKKSNDDEFLMAYVTGRVGNNNIAIKNTRTKLRRSFENTKGFINKVLGQYKELMIKDENGKLISVLVGSLDYDRLNRCIDQIAVGLFFHEFEKIFKGQVEVIFGFFEYRDNTNSIKSFLIEVFNVEGYKFPRKGSNPDVFYYQIIPQDTPGFHLFKLTFFEATDFFIRMQEDAAKEHFDLGAKFIKDGDESIVTYSGKEFKFNYNRGGDV